MRSLRNKDPDIYRLLTIRTVSGKLLMKPNRKVRRLIGGIVARYQELLSIELYAYIFLSNHPHMIAKAPEENIDEFMENVNREIAKRLNVRLHREGQFWGRRYDDQEILSEDDLLEAFLYVTTNATRHGLVSDTRLWAGLHCFDHVLSERDREFSFFHASARRDADKVTRHKLKLSVLPMFKDLSAKERKEKLLHLLEERMEHIREGRYQDGGGFIGMELVQEQDPEDVPLNMSRSPKSPCFTRFDHLRKDWVAQEKLRRERYAEASMRYRAGELDTNFPRYTFRPPTHRAPRLVPFQPLEASFFETSC